MNRTTDGPTTDDEIANTFAQLIRAGYQPEEAALKGIIRAFPENERALVAAGINFSALIAASVPAGFQRFAQYYRRTAQRDFPDQISQAYAASRYVEMLKPYALTAPDKLRMLLPLLSRLRSAQRGFYDGTEEFAQGSKAESWADYFGYVLTLACEPLEEELRRLRAEGAQG